MKNDVKKLKGIGIFKNFSEAMLEEFSEFFSQTEYSAGDIVFKEEESGDTLLVVVGGEIVIEKCLDKAKNEFKTLAILGKGDFFGEMAVLGGQTRFAQARAAKESVLYAISRPELINFIKKHPDAGVNVFTEITRITLDRLQHTSNELTMLFDMSKLLMKEHKSAPVFITQTIDEISKHLKGSWNINGYIKNRFDESYDLVASKESFMGDMAEKNVKSDRARRKGWMDNRTYLMAFSKDERTFGYITLTSSKELSENEKNNLTTIFDTVSFIVGSMVANINYWTDAILSAIDKGLIDPKDAKP